MNQWTVQGYTCDNTPKTQMQNPSYLGVEVRLAGEALRPQGCQSALIRSDASSKCVCVKSLQICPSWRPHDLQLRLLCP